VREAVLPGAARAAGRDPASVTGLREARVTARSEHGAVTELTLVVEVAEREGGGAPASAAIDTLRFGTQRIPGVLPTPAGTPLYSTRFEIVAPDSGVALAVQGRGSGHGVGLCQWGAIGRAREGAGYREILEAYYPGTELTRVR
jgi:stage II sporulation protein D